VAVELLLDAPTLNPASVNVKVLSSVWIDITGLVVDSLAGLAGIVALFMAVAAYKVAKRQSRYNFEVEILRELALLLEKDSDLQNRLATGDWSRSPIADAVQRRLALLPSQELLMWKRLFDDLNANKLYVEYMIHNMLREGEHTVLQLGVGTYFHEVKLRNGITLQVDPKHRLDEGTLSFVVIQSLDREILNAIRRRS
jgi:hypothetical protein